MILLSIEVGLRPISYFMFEFHCLNWASVNPFNFCNISIMIAPTATVVMMIKEILTNSNKLASRLYLLGSFLHAEVEQRAFFQTLFPISGLENLVFIVIQSQGGQ